MRDTEFDPWISAPMCGHRVLNEEIDERGYCINCSAWRAFKKHLIFTFVVVTLFIGSAIYVAYVIGQRP